MSNFTAAQQQLAPGIVVELYTLDATRIGGPVLRWTPGPFNGAPAFFAGNSYQPYPVASSGFEWSAKGQAPRPILQIANTGGYVTGLLVAYGDMRGAIVTRLRVLQDFLDGQPNADPSAGWKPDIYYVNRKSHHDNEYVEWELAMASDQEGIMLPRAQALRDNCSWIYRAWTGSGFDYSKVQCPYTGGAMFTQAGQATGDPTKDICGRKLSDCELRFGSGNVLPFSGFPGMLKA